MAADGAREVNFWSIPRVRCRECVRGPPVGITDELPGKRRARAGVELHEVVVSGPLEREDIADLSHHRRVRARRPHVLSAGRAHFQLGGLSQGCQEGEAHHGCFVRQLHTQRFVAKGLGLSAVRALVVCRCCDGFTSVSSFVGGDFAFPSLQRFLVVVVPLRPRYGYGQGQVSDEPRNRARTAKISFHFVYI